MQEIFTYMFKDNMFTKKAAILFLLLFIALAICGIPPLLNSVSYAPTVEKVSLPYLHYLPSISCFLDFAIYGYMMICIKAIIQQDLNIVLPFFNFKNSLIRGLKFYKFEKLEIIGILKMLNTPEKVSLMLDWMKENLDANQNEIVFKVCELYEMDREDAECEAEDDDVEQKWSVWIIDLDEFDSYYVYFDSEEEATNYFNNYDKNNVEINLFNPVMVIVLVSVFLTSLIIVCLGVSSIYQAKIYSEVKNRPIYIAKETNTK